MINLTRRYMILMSVLLHSWHYYPRHMFDETKKKEAATITVFCSKLEYLKRQSRLFLIFSALEPQFHHSWNICIEDYATGQCIIQGYSCVYRYRPGARLTKAYDVTIQRYRNSHAKIENSKIHVLRCMGSKFCVKFQRCPLKFHTKFWTHTPQKMHFTRF